MKSIYHLILTVLLFVVQVSSAQNRSVKTLNDNWQFMNEEVADAEKPETVAKDWGTVSVPHNWAIPIRGKTHF